MTSLSAHAIRSWLTTSFPGGSRWHRRLRGGLWIARWGVVWVDVVGC